MVAMVLLQKLAKIQIGFQNASFGKSPISFLMPMMFIVFRIWTLPPIGVVKVNIDVFLCFGIFFASLVA